MTAINQLASIDTLQTGDLLPVFSSSNGDTRKSSMTTLATFIQSSLTAPGAFATQYASPNATGFNILIAPVTDGESVYLLLTPTAGFAAGTITLPAIPSDGQEILVSCTQIVTTLTVSGNGKTVNGAPTTLTANAFLRLRYDGINNSWYRVG